MFVRQHPVPPVLGEYEANPETQNESRPMKDLFRVLAILAVASLSAPASKAQAGDYTSKVLSPWVCTIDGVTYGSFYAGTVPGGPAAGQPGFAFEGELISSEPPHRAVTTERMVGIPGPGTTNELTLTELQDGTLMSLLITYPSAEVRDMVLGTGMADGMEASYARLESTVLPSS